MRLILLLFCILCLRWGGGLAQPVVLFPGDTNNDGTANQFDLLPVGVAYGMEGFPRQNASIDWLPQILFPAWPDALPVSGINKGFVDCDGNGLIDTFDIEAITLNFDELQNNSQPPPMPYPPKLTDTCFTCPKPDIVITYNQDTVVTSGTGFDTLYAVVTLRYPPGVPTQNGALGIAFDLEYDYNPEKIKDAFTEVYPDTFPDTRMYVIATSTQAQFWRLPAPGKIGFAAAGRGANVFFMTDTLFVVRFVIEDLIIREEEKFSLNISNVLLINKLEQIVCFGNVKQEPVVITSPVSDPESRLPVVLLSPNPVREMLAVESPESPLEKMDLRGTDGRLLFSVNMEGKKHFYLPAGSLPPGVLLAHIYTRGGVVVKKIVRGE
ncbi:MAG: T9SS type A sorting domain-containing protein [Lewinellaceae bacterium]|nr:T9SS type A sorting domain-containing protein [Lewinellaceae bacterium]